MQNLLMFIIPSLVFAITAFILNWAHLTRRIDLGRWQKIVAISLASASLISPIIIGLIQFNKSLQQQSASEPIQILLINNAEISNFSIAIGMIIGLLLAILISNILKRDNNTNIQREKPDDVNQLRVLIPSNVELRKEPSMLSKLLSRSSRFMYNSVSVTYIITVIVCIVIGGFLGFQLKGVTSAVIEYSGYPTFAIAATQRDSNVTIWGTNFPPNDTFWVRMNWMHTQGVGGVVVQTVTTDANGNLSDTTYPIPDFLKGTDRIAIRFESLNSPYYYAHNWFYNKNAP